jgi:hypothetical protein
MKELNAIDRPIVAWLEGAATLKILPIRVAKSASISLVHSLRSFSKFDHNQESRKLVEQLYAKDLEIYETV